MIETIVLGAIGSLLAAGVIGAGGFFLGKVLGNKQGIQKGIEKGREIEKGEFRKKYETAIHSFSNEIQKLIDQAARATQEDLFASAKAVVSTRDSMRETLSDIARLLNSDIDQLKQAIGDVEKTREKDKVDDLNRIRELIAVLTKTWPAKKPQVDIAWRKVLVESGLIEANDSTGF